MSKPAFIIAAENALENCRDHADYDQLQKRLPGLAARMHQAGETVTEEKLTEAGLKGAAHVEALIKSLNTKPSKPSYDSIVADLNAAQKAEEVEDETIPDDINKRLTYYARKGNNIGIEKALNQGANIHYHNNLALALAAVEGHVETLKFLLEKGADIDALQTIGHEKYSALYYAVANKKEDAVQFLLEKGAKINNGAVITLWPAMDGRLDLLEMLTDYGADLHAEKERTLMCAVQTGQIAVVEWLLTRNVDIHAQDEEALLMAIELNNLEITRLLLENGADVTARDHLALILSAGSADQEITDLLVTHGAEIQPDWNDTGLHLIANAVDQGFLIEQICKIPDLATKTEQLFTKIDQWYSVAGVMPPAGCLDFSPHLFTDKKVQNAQREISDILHRKENLRHCEAECRGFELAVLFGSTEKMLQYLKKWGKAGKRPLFAASHMVEAPPSFSEKTDFKAWAEACIQHGPKMAELFTYADRYPRPLRSHDNTNWLYKETLNDISRFAYKNAGQDLKLAQLFFSHRMPEKYFNHALQLTRKFQTKSRIPDISFTLPNGLRYRKLADRDYRGLILGKLTSCCQSIGNIGDNGDKCARHGYRASNSGFYVVEDKKGEIIGQSWAWLGPNNELMLDSLEHKIDRLDSNTWTSLIKEFAKQVDQKAPEITAIHIGRGGETPRLPFKKAAGVKLNGYIGYHDSKGLQYQAYKRRMPKK